MAEREHAIGRYRLQPGRQLLVDGVPVPIGTKALDILTALVEAAGDVVTKDELLERVWPGVFIAEHTIQVHISMLRKALGAEADWIQTVPRRGYRFNGAVGTASSPGAEPPARASDLPRPPTRLVGREADVAAALEVLAANRLVTLTGPGGVGKTRLALEIAQRALPLLRDGACFVDLAVLGDAGLLPSTVATALGVALRPDEPPLEPIARRLKSQSLLILLDNCEHVIDAAASFAEGLLQRTSTVRLLATSREPLACAGEQVYRLAPLALPSADVTRAEAALESGAVALLVDRVRAADSGFALTDAGAAAAGQICRGLDGLPLAIEMASAWVPTFGLDGLAARVDAAFTPPAGARRTAQPRHRSLQATLDWSHDLLSDAEQRALRRLAVFAGSFSLPGAEAVVSGADLAAAEVPARLAALVGKSLVTVAAGSAPPRYRLLETTRAYAAEKLAQAGENGRIARLAAYLRDFFRRAARDYAALGADAWLPRCGPELDNLRAALAWAFGPEGDAELGIELVCDAGPLYNAFSLLAERIRWVQEARRRTTEATPPEHRAALLLNSASGTNFGNPGLAAAALEAVALLRRCDRPSDLGYALTVAGSALLRPGDTAEGERHLHEAEALLRPLGPSARLSGLLAALSGACYFAGDLARAAAYGREAVELARGLEMQQWSEIATTNLAELEFLGGRAEAAIRLMTGLREEARRHGNLRALGAASTNLGSYLIGVGRLDDARDPLREALGVNQQLDSAYRTVICIEHLARLAAERGAAARAARLAGFTDRYYRSQGRPREAIEAAGRDALQTVLAGALDAIEIARWNAMGETLTEEQAVALALED